MSESHLSRLCKVGPPGDRGSVGIYWWSILEGDIGGYELNGGRRLFIKLLMLLFDGCVKADDGDLGKLSMQFNEDVGNKMMADVMWSAMINEGNDCNDYRP